MVLEKKKGGLSTVVATLLIVLLVLVAVGLVWVILKNVMQNNSDQVSLAKFSLDLEIKDINRSVSDNSMEVTVKRNSGKGDISGILFIADDGNTTESVNSNVYLNEFEETTIEVNLTSEINVSNLQKVSIAPIFVSTSGKDVIGGIVDEYIFPATMSGEVSVCADSCSSLNYVCGTYSFCDTSTNCGTCPTGYTCDSVGQCVILPCDNITCNGDGTLENPYKIYNCTRLQDIKNNLRTNYVLANNIDCSDTINWNSGAGFIPIGSLASSFSGNFDGQNYTITGLFIYNKSADYVGLFSAVAGTFYFGGVIKNVGLVNVNITGRNYVGGLIGGGHNDSKTIINSYSTGSVNGVNSVGGLVGENYGAIENSYSIGIVNGTYYIGGLVGDNYYGPITDSYSTVNVTGRGILGGLVGENTYGIITDSHANGSVIGTQHLAGGLAGDNSYSGLIINCYANGEVRGGLRTGGLVGHNYEGIITDSYSTGNVIGTDSSAGFVGFNYGTVTNSYSTGNVTGRTYVGGFIGENYYSDKPVVGVVTNSYSTGNVNAVNYTGGFIGQNSKTITDSYSTGNVNCTGGFVGGFLGYIRLGNVTRDYSTGNVNGLNSVGGFVGGGWDGIINNSYSTGNVNGRDGVGGFAAGGYVFYVNSYSIGNVTGRNKVGGFVGDNYGGIVMNCYAKGNVIGTDQVGGLAGYNYRNVTYSYSTGKVTGVTNVGGLTGKVGIRAAVNSYWDVNTSGKLTSADGIGKTTIQMKQKSTYVGWNFTNIWKINEGVDYPYLFQINF